MIDVFIQIAVTLVAVAPLYYFVTKKEPEPDPDPRIDTLISGQDEARGRDAVLEGISRQAENIPSLATLVQEVQQRLGPTADATNVMSSAMQEMQRRLDHATENMPVLLDTTKDVKQDIAETRDDIASRIDNVSNLLTNPRVKGATGERLVGLTIKHVIPHRFVEEQVEVGDGLRADFVVKIPGRDGIIIDSKNISAGTFNQTLQQIKKYQGLDGYEKFVILVIPNEGVLAEVFERNQQAYENAIQRGIFITSLTGLGATLHILHDLIYSSAIREQEDHMIARIRGIHKGLEDLAEQEKKDAQLWETIGRTHKLMGECIAEATSNQQQTSFNALALQQQVTNLTELA